MSRKKLPQLQYQPDLWQAHDMLVVDPQLGKLDPDILVAISRSSSHDRHSVYALSTIFSKLSGKVAGSREEKWEMDGVIVRAQIARLLAFKNNQSCACCSLKGTFFLMERHTRETEGAGYSLVLYAIDKHKDLVPLTVDHILPDAMGGRYSSVNFQTMCKPCNQGKGHLMDMPEIDLVRENPAGYAKEWVNLDLLLDLLDLREESLYAETDEAYDSLHKMFEHNRRYLDYGIPPEKQQQARDRINAHLDYLNPPPVVAPLKWYQRIWRSIVS